VDLVDEEHVARLQVGEQRGEIAGALNDRPGRQAVADAHLARDDLGQSRLAETGRTREENMVEGFAARACGRNKDPQILADLALPDEIVEGERSQRGFGEIVLAAGAVDDFVGQRGLEHPDRLPRRSCARRAQPRRRHQPGDNRDSPAQRQHQRRHRPSWAALPAAATSRWAGR
jgi:hypothetical protein